MHTPYFVQAVRIPPTYSVADLMRRLGQEACGTRPRSIAWQLGYLRDLIADCGFPPPLPLRIRDRETGAHRLSTDPQRASRWPRIAVDIWFEEQLAPDVATSVDAAERRAGSAIMDERARAIGLHLVDGGAA